MKNLPSSLWLVEVFASAGEFLSLGGKMPCVRDWISQSQQFYFLLPDFKPHISRQQEQARDQPECSLIRAESNTSAQTTYEKISQSTVASKVSGDLLLLCREPTSWFRKTGGVSGSPIAFSAMEELPLPRHALGLPSSRGI